MKDFKDRQPTKPGRRKVTFSDGRVEYVTLEMADEPTEVGTPLNRETFMNLQGFAEENTTISENGNTTTVKINHADGGKTETKIIVVSDTLTRVLKTYTNAGGLSITKETTIDTSSGNVVIGGAIS